MDERLERLLTKQASTVRRVPTAYGQYSGNALWQRFLDRQYRQPVAFRGQTEPPLRRLNDLWRYDIATGMWTWMNGANTVEQVGTYGTPGSTGCRQRARSAL